MSLWASMNWLLIMMRTLQATITASDDIHKYIYARSYEWTCLVMMQVVMWSLRLWKNGNNKIAHQLMRKWRRFCRSSQQPSMMHGGRHYNEYIWNSNELWMNWYAGRWHYWFPTILVGVSWVNPDKSSDVGGITCMSIITKLAMISLLGRAGNWWTRRIMRITWGFNDTGVAFNVLGATN